MHRSIALLLAISALGLAACGSDDSSSSASAPESTPGASATTPAATAAATDAATEAATEAPVGGGKLTKPGTKLAVGETGHVTITPLNADFDSKQRFDLDVAVTKIEKGSIDDFKNIDVDGKTKESVPYYVSVKVSNPGPKAVPVKDDDPDIRFGGIDDRGQEQGSITFFGDFASCDDRNATPPKMQPGDSYESCLTYLMPGGGSIDSVQWTGSNEYLTAPVVWK